MVPLQLPHCPSRGLLAKVGEFVALVTRLSIPEFTFVTLYYWTLTLKHHTAREGERETETETFLRTLSVFASLLDFILILMVISQNLSLPPLLDQSHPPG